MVFVVIFLLYVLLLIPDEQKSQIHTAVDVPYAWNSDSLWHSLEGDFVRAGKMNPDSLDAIVQQLHRDIEQQLRLLQQTQTSPTDERWPLLLNKFFSLTAHVSAQKNPLPIEGLYTETRTVIKDQSQQWDMTTREARNTVYEMLYGMRAALEETVLQADTLASPMLAGTTVASATPSTKIFDIPVHSGDLLVSRGGAEVSALISRGNDYPGNFSHVALVYIDEISGQPYLLEAHIEKGVALATAEQYIHDKKLRFMVLRLRADLPELLHDPMLPQKAAKMMYEETFTRHIPYDFRMNFYDSTAMFCSEVGSYAYRKNGVRLWTPISTISSTGTIRWLNTFGVENFVTQMPTDLEYDPQLMVVAEWRDTETLFKDHVDNAVMDALLECANQGEEIPYSFWMLPIARVLKGYCMVQNYFGKPAMIPEGMSATQALKNNSFVERYQTVQTKTMEAITLFENEKGYRPPYWKLVELARQSAVVN
jgi:hypothetical protein